MQERYEIRTSRFTLRVSESGEQCDDGSASSSDLRRRHRGGPQRLLLRRTPYLYLYNMYINV